MRMNGTHGPTTVQTDSRSDRPHGEVTAKKIIRLLEWQHYKCALSGVELTTQNCQADHIVPVAEGGRDVMENVQLVVAEVNKAKGTMGQSEFIQMCERVARRWQVRD